MPKLRTFILVALLSLYPNGVSSAGPSAGSARLLAEVAVRIEAETADARGLCAGWIGWSEPSRSAVYTAAHCHREGATYRVFLASGDAVYATGLTWWNEQDLMALWIPIGGLRMLRIWKPLPVGTFRALHILNTPGKPLQILETPVERVISEIRFYNHPAAVAIPVASAPGTSGAPLVDAADGRLLGMVVGHLTERRDISAVIPARFIHDVLAGASRPASRP